LNFIGSSPKAQRPTSRGSCDDGNHTAQQKPEYTGELFDDDDEVEVEVQAAAIDSPKELSVASKSSMMKIHADYRQSHAIDEAHWAQLLNEVRHFPSLRKWLTLAQIGEVRGYLQTQQKQYEEQTQRIAMLMRRSPDDPGPSLLFGSSKSISRSEILSQLPSKYACDTMLAHYFASLDPALCVYDPRKCEPGAELDRYFARADFLQTGEYIDSLRPELTPCIV
jgi:hypothetical protein